MTVFEIPSEKVRRRADFFLAEATQMCAVPRYAEYEFSLTDQNAQFLAEAYYLLSEAYKERRQTEGHRTQPPKIASLTTAVVATMNPLRPAKPPNKPNNITTYINPLFALRLADAIIDHPFKSLPWERTQWFCDGIRGDSLQCLAQYVEVARTGDRVVGSPFDMEISRDELRRIEDRFNFFYVLHEMPVFKQD